MSEEREREEDYGFEVDPPVYTFYAEEKKSTLDTKKENSETSSKDEREYYVLDNSDDEPYVAIDAKIVEVFRKIEARAMVRGAIYAAVGFLVGSILSKIIF